MMPQTGPQIIAIHTLPNILRSKSTQAMKFGQLLKYNMKNIFLEKLYPKCVEEVSLRFFHKKSKLTISLDQQSENVINFILVECPIWVLPKYITSKVLTTCYYLTWMSFLKKKQIRNKSAKLIVSMIFKYNYSSQDILFSNQILLPDCFYFLRYWTICVLQSFCCLVYDVISFEINQTILLHDQKFRTTMYIS